MEKMTDLQDLLKHEIKDLYSAEEQIIEAMPRMIEKATNPQLREALEMHLRITEGQLSRLEQVQQLMAQSGGQESGNGQENNGNNGLFARLMKRRNQGAETGSGGEKCLGMEGLLKEGEKVMGEEMEPTVLDAAIIACAQKIEHYEICGYGTARAYARELNMGEVAELLEQTLDEEYEADDRLTDMAVGRLNEEAEMGGRASRSNGRSASSATGRNSGRATASKSTSRSRTGVAQAASNSRNGSSPGRGASTGRGSASAGSGRSSDTSKGAAAKTSGRGGSSPAPTGKASASRSTSKSTGRGESSSKTRPAAASRSGKVPSKAAAAKGGRNSSGGGRTASKSTGRGSSSGRSSGRK